MASPTQWTWVWVESGSWWWTGRPGMLQFMGLQRVGHRWATELNWTPTLLPSLISSLPFPHSLGSSHTGLLVLPWMNPALWANSYLKASETLHLFASVSFFLSFFPLAILIARFWLYSELCSYVILSKRFYCITVIETYTTHQTSTYFTLEVRQSNGICSGQGATNRVSLLGQSICLVVINITNQLKT